jgi:hypothetical protein
MNDNLFDSRLLIYQALLAIPSEVLMLEIYDRIQTKDANTYSVMSLLNLGSYIGSLAIAKGLYHALHKDSPIRKEDHAFYLSPLSEYLYSNQLKRIQKEEVFKKGSKEDKLNERMAKEPVYSEKYMQLAWSLYGLKTAYATMNSPVKNPLGKLLYGLTQPLAVTLKDSGAIK